MKRVVGTGWEGAPLDAVEPRGIAEIVVGLDAGQEVMTPKVNQRFGAYDLYEASRYLIFLSNQIRKGSVAR